MRSSVTFGLMWPFVALPVLVSAGVLALFQRATAEGIGCLVLAAVMGYLAGTILNSTVRA